MKVDSRAMCEGPILKNVIIYTVPIILTGLLQLLFNAADLAVVGWFCDSVSVAAVGATSSLANLIVNLFVGLSLGGGVAVAQAMGAGDKVGTSRAIHTTVSVAFISGIITTVIGVTLSGYFLSLMGTPEGRLSDLAETYMRIFFAGNLFSMLYNFGSSILRAMGDTRSPLIFITVSGALNVMLNIIFVAGFQMDVAGVALATAISFGVSAMLVLRTLVKRDDFCKLQLKKLRIYKDVLLKIIRIGIPSGLQGAMFSISNVIIQSSINSFGTTYITGSSAAASIEGFCYMTMNAFSQTSLNFCGQNYGAKNLKRVKKVTFICLFAVTFAGLLIGNLMYLFGEQLLGIYIKDSSNAIAHGMVRLAYILIPYFLCGAQEVMGGALRGLGCSLTPMIITLVGVCAMRIWWIYTVFAMEKYHTFAGLFVSYPISWLFTLAALFIAFGIVISRRTRQMRSWSKTE